MFKVAYIFPSLNPSSGWYSHAKSFIGAMAQHVTAILFVAQEDKAQAGKIFPGREIFTLPVTQQLSLHSKRGLFKLPQTYWEISRNTYPVVDLVHSLEAFPTGLVGHWLSRKQKCPHVITAHGTYALIWHEQWLNRWVYQKVLRNAKMICPVSHGTGRLMKQYFAKALEGVPIKPVNNGNAYYQAVPRQEALERKIPQQPTLLSVGAVKPRKGQHISLAAFAQVKTQLPSARYWIIGGYSKNAYWQGMQNFIQKNDVEDVTFLGRVPQEKLAQYYQQSSVFVLTPQQVGLHIEGFGLVYLEAGAFGLPVVATRTGGVADAVVDGKTGYLLDPDDVDGIAQAILDLLTDDGAARQMGRANRLHAESFTWERAAKEQYAYYQEIIQ